jgi:predicted porin
MKKSLLALAVLGAFAGAASAQSSVTIYGVVDAGIDRIDNGANSTVNLDSGNNAANRIGFKGVEDLGNGLKAEFLLENGFEDNGAGKKVDGTIGAFSRLAYLGLNGGFGKVRLGRQNSPIKEAVSKFDTFGSSGMVNGVDFLNGGGVTERVSNQIAWISNNYGGFQGEIGYRFGEVAGNNSANRGYGAQLGYANGPLSVQFGYDNQNSRQLDADGLVVPGGVDADVKDWILGASYDFGGFKLHGSYGQRKVDAGATVGDLAAATEDYKVRSYMIGASVPFGASKIRAEYIRNDNRDIDNADNNVWALSYTYAMSKRTTLYATYARVSNDDNSNLGIGGPGALDTAGENGSGAAIGVEHKF